MTPSKLDDTACSSATGHGALNWHLSLSYLAEHIRLGTHCRPLLGQAPSIFSRELTPEGACCTISSTSLSQ